MEALLEQGMVVAARFPGGHIVRTFVTIFRLWYSGVLILPYASIICIALGLLYFVSPLDLIPDVLPIIGYVDDVAVLSAIIYYVIPMFVVNNLIRRIQIFKRHQKQMHNSHREISSKKHVLSV